MISVLLLIAGQQKTPPPTDFPFPSVLYRSEGVADFQLAIVKGVKRLGYEIRDFRSKESTNKVEVALDEATVVDSSTKLAKKIVIATPFAAIAPGTQFGPRTAELRRLAPNKNQLVAYFDSKGDSHRLPQEGFWNDGSKLPEEFRYALIAKGSARAEVLGIGAFETKAVKLSEKESAPIDRIMLNVVETLFEADIKGVQRACFTLRYAVHGRHFYNNVRGDRLIANVPNDSTVVKRMRELMPGMSASNRSRVAMVLFIWNVKGGSFDLVEAIRASENDPALFNSEGDVYVTDKGFEYGAISGRGQTQQDEKHLRTAFFEMAIETKSPGLRWLLLNNCNWVPTNSGQRKALALASSAADDEANLVFGLLAQWNQDTENVPKFELVGSNRMFINRGALIEHWKIVLGL